MSKEVKMILDEIRELENRQQNLYKKIEKIKAKEYKWCCKVVVPYECSAKTYGEYVAYFEDEDKAKEVVKSIQNDESMYHMDIDWEVANEVVTDTYDDDFITEEIEIKKIGE